MADPKQHPHEQHQFTDHEKNVLTQLRPMMGGLSDEDKEVEEHLQRIEEANAAKMRAAQTGGASEGLGPSDIEQALIKQREAFQQATAGQGQQAAAQAQAQQTIQPPPAAPSGPAGVTQPFAAQRGPQGSTGPAAGTAVSGAQPSAAPAAPGQEEAGPEEEE